MAAAAATAVQRGPGGALRARLDAHRWHFQHGPIDIVLGADGDAGSVAALVEDAWARMQTILAELVEELPVLRTAVDDRPLRGAVARRMQAACLAHRPAFITPMAAVAGAVADELIERARAHPGLRRAYANNGGDIALHLAPGASYRVGLFADLSRVERREAWRLDGDAEIAAASPVRGVATSGWRGRSFSLGIADAVTVLAASAAQADAAATMIANAVNVDHPAIERRAAGELDDDSDLGDRRVTVQVPRLPLDAVDAALATGCGHARALVERGAIHAAVIWLQGRVRTAGVPPEAAKSCTFRSTSP